MSVSLHRVSNLERMLQYPWFPFLCRCRGLNFLCLSINDCLLLLISLEESYFHINRNNSQFWWCNNSESDVIPYNTHWHRNCFQAWLDLISFLWNLIKPLWKLADFITLMISSVPKELESRLNAFDLSKYLTRNCVLNRSCL